jgi:hypothetical protein
MKFNKIIVGGVLLTSLIIGVKCVDLSCIQECARTFVEQTEMCGTFAAAASAGSPLLFLIGLAPCEVGVLIAYGICKSVC